MDLEPGAVIAGRYRVERQVGSGGMSEVWAGAHVTIGIKVALKKLLPTAAVDQHIVARFKREANLLGRIRSEHVARVVDFVADESFGLVLVMDFIEGESLHHILEARRLTVEETIDLGVEMAEALCDLHRTQIVHRDLKPANIIMEPLHDGRKRAVLVDFGVSRLIHGSPGSDEDLYGLTYADMSVGTIAYMAPEQLTNARDVTGAADVYALGAMLYRAVTGKHVFGDVDDAGYATKKLSLEPGALELPRDDRVARGLSIILRRALRRRTNDRFASAAAMLAELTSLRDVARAMELDLDATTEQAAPVAEEGGARQNLSGGASAMQGVGVDPAVRSDAVVIPVSGSADVIVDELTMPDVSRRSRVSIRMPPEPPKPPKIEPPRFEGLKIGAIRQNPVTPMRVVHAGVPRVLAVWAVVLALLGGGVLGFLLHAELADPPLPKPSTGPGSPTANDRR